MKHVASSLFVVPVVTFALVGCGSADGDVDPYRDTVGDAGLLHFQVDSEKPLTQGENDLRISIREASTEAPFVGAAVHVLAIMPAMAHDAPRATAIEDSESGTYVATGFALPMAGRWYVEVTASRQQTVDAARFTYDLR
ncbi:MAG: FixH family protein [Polyangiaceae bacterium]|nr:FixH family protein [Polyangiaceae bacterium]